jgi:hypothetical protein
MSINAGVTVHPDENLGACIGSFPWPGPDIDGIGRGDVWGTDEDEYILNITAEIRNGQENVARLYEIARELHQRRKELYAGPSRNVTEPKQLYDRLQTSWDTRQVLDGYDKLDHVVMGLIADLSEQKIMPEAFRAKYDEALLAHHNRTGPFEWPEYDAGHAAHEHHRVFTAGDEYPRKILQEDAVCSLPVRIVPYGLRISPAEFLKKHRPDWIQVAQPEGEY